MSDQPGDGPKTETSPFSTAAHHRAVSAIHEFDLAAAVPPAFIGDYRIIVDIRDNVLLILVVRVGHRREIYKR